MGRSRMVPRVALARPFVGRTWEVATEETGVSAPTKRLSVPSTTETRAEDLTWAREQKIQQPRNARSCARAMRSAIASPSIPVAPTHAGLKEKAARPQKDGRSPAT